MTSSKISTLIAFSPFLPEPQESRSRRWVLKWRQKQLIVSLAQQPLLPQLPVLENQQSLIECLRHSSVQLVRLDPALDEASLQYWADSCEQANKIVFLRLPTAAILQKQRLSSSWRLKQLSDRLAAALILLVMSPAILMLALLLSWQSSQPIFSRQWCVGERGRLFRRFQFRTTFVYTPLHQHGVVGQPKTLPMIEAEPPLVSLGRWLHKHGLDKLPQLFNILRGEMGLVGRPTWTLHEAVRLSSKEQQQLNALPGAFKVQLQRF